MLRPVLIFALALSLWQCTSDQQNTSLVTDTDTVTVVNHPEETTSTATTQVTAERADVIDCLGIGNILFTDTYADLEQKLGKTNLKQDSIFLEGEYQGIKLVAYPGTNKEVHISWKEDKPVFKNITSLSTDKKNSTYKLANGIKVGSTLKELIAANGGNKFSFYGFGWDYGGAITNFNNGIIAQDFPCFTGVLNLEKEVSGKDADKMLGDGEKVSSDPVFLKYPIYLGEIRIGKNN